MRRIHELFEGQAAATPERVAVIVGERELRYDRLAAMAAGVARGLREQGVRRGDLVGVCLDRDEWLIAALLGVLRAGAAYVPLDPAYPAERRRFIVRDAGLEHVVTSRAHAPVAGARALLVDEVRPDGNGIEVPGDLADAAYVIYTSGSTGQPKGVVIEHRQTVNLLGWVVRTYSPLELAGCLAAASVCFDVSVSEIFGPLVSGGTVILADDLLALPTLPARDRVVMIDGPPSGLAALLRQPLPASVRTVTTGGEVVTRALAERLFAQPGVRRVRNLYGPTECATTCLAADLEPGDAGPPPLGEPLDGVEAQVLDAEGRPVPDGVVGELWVAGAAVGRGYLNRPELTERRFVADPNVAGGRRYGTGDLVRRVDGIFHFVGRTDDQVKIRGFRVELGEVEHALAAHPDVALAVASAPVDQWGARSLHAHVQPTRTGAVTEPRLREYLRERLPAYLVPSRIGVVERIPLLPNDKVDRTALPPLAPARPEVGASPKDPTEERIARIVAEALGLPAVGVLDRFTDLGGHSLAAARVVASVGEEFGAVVPLARFLADPTVRGLAASVAEGGAAVPVRHRGRKEFPLTDVQREFWTLRQIEPDSTATTLAVRLRVTGLSDARPLRAALDALVERHEVLRTVFLERPAGPVAVVRPATSVPLTEHDDPGRLEEWVSAAARQVFDLEHDVPLIRATVIWTVTGAELVLAIDHCAFDGYSIGPLMTELLAGLTDGPHGILPLQVGDLAVYEQDQPSWTSAEEFWRTELAGVTPPYHLTARTRHGQPVSPSARSVRALDPRLEPAINRLAEDVGVTPFSVYLSALAMVLTAMTGERETLVGVVSALRDRPGSDRLIGPLVGVLPIRVASSDETTTFHRLTADVAATMLRARAHQDLPAGAIAECAAVGRTGESLTPVLISMQPNEVPPAIRAGDVRVELLGELGSGESAHDLTLYVNRTVAGPELELEYDTRLFDRADAEAITGRLMRVLSVVTAEPDRPLAELDFMEPGELRTLLAAGAGPALPAGELPTVVEAVLEQAERTPDAIAVSDVDGELSYSELVRHSGRLAAALTGAGVVGVCLPRDRYLPAALLGVWRSGAAYVALDPGLPRDRLEWIAGDSGAEVVVSAGSALPVARAISGVRVVDQHALTVHSGQLVGGPGELAYLCYTSGSSGRPKGVEVAHANLSALTAALRAWPGIGPEDVVFAVAPLVFDASVSDIWPVLTAGGRVVVVDRDTAIDGYALAERIAAVGATILKATPTTLRMILAGGWPGNPRLRVWSGGEALDAGLARELAARVGELWNVYGPTETTAISVACRIPSGAVTVPIGRPVAGEWVYVMDARGRPVPPGMVGELWIGGAGVSRGYRGRPELTDERFVPDPLRPGNRCYRTGDLVRQRADGALEFLGRRDHQVKIRGYRVELGEVEAAIRDVPGVRDAVVTASNGSDAHLVGYLVLTSTMDTNSVANRLREKLPEYLVPRRWVTMPKLPTLPSGKVDRAALPEPARESTGAPPGTEIEKLVAGVWREVLGVPEPHLDEDFFALGGHSFAATRVAGRLRDTLGCRVPVRMLFDHPTLADFALRLEQAALAEIMATPEGAA